ncbi:MAG: hypothetical protein PVJ71_03785 [Lysobacterales bacterium]
MIILTDSIPFAQDCFPHKRDWRKRGLPDLDAAAQVLANELFTAEAVMVSELPGEGHWDYLFAVEHASRSQYDALAELAGSGAELPGRVLCCAAEGARFHGFKGRSWQACRGNIHLSAYVTPDMAVNGGAAGFIVASVVAALQAAESVDLHGERPAIKWVNDLLIGGAKVGGVLARLQTQRDTVKGAVVGIGLNVERRPQVERDPYVPAVASLADFARHGERCRHADVFAHLAERLGENIGRLLRGEYDALLEIYRQHSAVIGRWVTILEERQDAPADVIASGRVNAIGRALELHVEGHARPVTKGRVILEPEKRPPGDGTEKTS